MEKRAEMDDVNTRLTGGEYRTKDNDIDNANDNDVSDVSTRSVLVTCLRNNIFLIAVLGCAVLGFLLGFGLRGLGEISEPALMWLGFPGELFMRTLKLIILPLLVVSVISGSATLDPKTNGKVTMATFIYMMLMNASGVLVGMVMFYVIKPHTGIADQIKFNSCFDRDVKLSTGDIFADMLRNVFPDNMVTACFQKAQTHYAKVEVRQGCDTNVTIEDYVKSVESSGGINVMGIIFFCVAVGIACGKVGEKARPIVDFFTAASEVILMMMQWVVWLTPIGVLSLIATSIVKAKDIETTLTGLAMFAVTVIAAILFHMLIVLPTVYIAFMRKNPYTFLLTALRPMMAGFGPSSSAIAIPEVINVAENVYGVSPVISRFCTLLGATISRCGSGAFITVTTLFLVYLDGVSLSPGQVVSMAVLTTVSTLALPAVPSSAIVTIVIVLSTLDVLPRNIGMVMALEWLLDRIRTTNNVLCSLCGNIVIDKILSNRM